MNNHKIGGVGVANGCPGAHTPPVVSSISSRLISASVIPKQTALSINIHLNHDILAGNSLICLSKNPGSCHTLHPYTHHIARAATMEGFEFGGDNAISEGPGMGITTMDPYMGVQRMY